MEITPLIRQQEDYDGRSIIKPGTLIIDRYLVEKKVGGCDSLSNVYRGLSVKWLKNLDPAFSAKDLEPRTFAESTLLFQF